MDLGKTEFIKWVDIVVTIRVRENKYLIFVYNPEGGGRNSMDSLWEERNVNDSC